MELKSNLAKTQLVQSKRRELDRISDSSSIVTPAALKLKDACAYLGGISPATLRRVISRGLIKPNRALRHILIPICELDRFLKSGGGL